MNSREYEIIMNAKKLINCNDKEVQTEGIESLEELANEKNKYALYELAMLYYEGKIVGKNIKKACNLFVFSGELGNLKSFYNAGKIFQQKGEIETAIRFYEKAKFSPEANLELAKLYYKKTTSVHKSITYFINASKLGCPEADYFLAEIYLLGKSVKVDHQKGTYYLNRALRKGIQDKSKLKNILSIGKQNKNLNYSIN